jgi:G3E family GTPase
VLAGPGADRADDFERFKRGSILQYSGDATLLADGIGVVPGEALYRLPVDAQDGAETTITVVKDGHYALFTQHLPEEFDLVLTDGGEVLAPVSETEYASPHEHDETVGSVGITMAGSLNPDRFERWMVDLLRLRGVDIFRAKGVLSLTGDDKRFVFQGVHMLFDGEAGRPWAGNEERKSQLIFIGRELDRAALEEGLRSCLD